MTSSGADRAVVLIVDDAPDNLLVLSELLRGEHRVLAANSGAAALQVAGGELVPDLILLDIMMPGLDGRGVLRALRSAPRTRDIPVIFVTALGAGHDEESALAMGAVDYITKPIRPEVLRARVRTHLEAYRYRRTLHARNASLEAEVMRRMTECELVQQAGIRALAHLAETRDPETGNHILRTQQYVQRLAECLRDHPDHGARLTAEYIDLLSRSAPLHDIGKVGIPDHILLKPAALTDEERRVMQTHTLIGVQAIELAERDINARMPFFELAKEIARSHHERWDGRGYPDGLAGDRIPLSARLMAVADVFDALISRRVYKPPMPYTKARDIMREEQGRHFDPDIAAAFLRHFDDFADIARDTDDAEDAEEGARD